MKTLQLILILSFFGLNCSHSSKQKRERTREIFTFIKKDGIIIDTIYNDSLIDKAKIISTQIINNKFYLIYSKYKVDTKLRSFYQGHFLCSYDLDNLPAKKGELFDYDKILSKDTSLLLEQPCADDNDIEFKKFSMIPSTDSVFYIYLKISNCSEMKTHMIIKKSDRHFEKLFEIQSTDYIINFSRTNDSTIVCGYRINTEGESNTFDLRYDFKNEMIIK